jgi:hypothetical protein
MSASISSLVHSTLCFVCAHLAAHRGNVSGRNADFRSIVMKTLFSGDSEKEWVFRGLQQLNDTHNSRTSSSSMHIKAGLHDMTTVQQQNCDADMLSYNNNNFSNNLRYTNNTLERTYGILDHDVVFWVGDLNYRVAEYVSTEEVCSTIYYNQAHRAHS